MEKSYIIKDFDVVAIKEDIKSGRVDLNKNAIMPIWLNTMQRLGVLTQQETYILVELCRFEVLDNVEESSPTKYIRKRTGYSESSIRRVLAEYEDLKMIEKIN